MSTDALAAINTRRTDQFTRSDARQIKNHSGAYVFQTSDEERLRRFLVLGSQGGTFYQGETELTRENADLILRYVANDPVRLVEVVVEMSVQGRTPKQNPLLFALAAATNAPSLEGRKAAFDAMPVVLRTGTQFMLFERYVKQFRGRGMGLRKAEHRWLESRDADSLAYQMVKYRQREGFTWRDILRMVKQGKTSDPARDALYGWVARGDVSEGLPKIVHGFLKAQDATTVAQWVSLVKDYGLSWEMLPDAARKEAEVWRALIDKGMPWTALQRQLPTLTRLDLLSPLKAGNRLDAVIARLTDVEAIKKARVHPMNVLVALRTYSRGRSLKGTGTWTSVQPVVDALDRAFYLAFKTVEPTDKATLIALDVSGSMALHPIMDSPLTPREASAAMSLVTAATEDRYQIVGYTGELVEVGISPRMRLDDAIKKVSGLSFGPTNCALPFEYALSLGLEIETFISYTDNETNGGRRWQYGGSGNPIQVHQALNAYREKTGINARHVVVGMTATNISVLDPNDAGSLGVIGFDSAAPSLISDFSRGVI